MKRFVNISRALSLAGLTLMAPVGPVAGAETLYRWIDDNGEVQFSDRQPPAGIEYRTISPQNFAPAPPPPPITETGPREAPEMEMRVVRGAEETAGVDEAGAAAEQARVYEHNCRVARDRLESLTNLRRVFSTDEFGNQVLLDSVEREAKIADAQANINQWCKGP